MPNSEVCFSKQRCVNGFQEIIPPPYTYLQGYIISLGPSSEGVEQEHRLVETTTQNHLACILGRGGEH